MIRTILVEDEKGAIEVFKSLFELHEKDYSLVAIASNVLDAARLIKECKPDVVILDISLPDGTGFDVLEAVGGIDFEVVFITAHEQFALQAIKNKAFDYLLKPLHSKELHACLLKLKDVIASKQSTTKYKSLALHTIDGIEFLEFKELVYLKSESNYTEIFMHDGTRHIASRTLKTFEASLDTSFARIHQSYIVSLKHIAKFSKADSTVILKNKQELPVSKSRKEALLKALL